MLNPGIPGSAAAGKAVSAGETVSAGVLLICAGREACGVRPVKSAPSPGL